MGKLAKIIKENNSVELLKQALPNEIKENLDKFKPKVFDVQKTMSDYHNDERKIFTYGSYVPMPYLLTILPIFTGGKDSDRLEDITKNLTLHGSKAGEFSVHGKGNSSDISLYVFAFILQMCIFRKTSLIYIDLPYLCEYLGWSNTANNKKRIESTLQRLMSVSYEGIYSGVFKSKRKKQSLLNSFEGRLMDGYYLDKDKNVLIVNISCSILSLFAIDKVWYGINIEAYSKIPTGHSKTLALYIGGKSRGLNEISFSAIECSERMGISLLKNNKQKTKVLKDSLDNLKELKIIKSYDILGHHFDNKEVHVKFQNNDFFEFSKIKNTTSSNSLKCHAHHKESSENYLLKSIFKKITTISDLESSNSNVNLLETKFSFEQSRVNKKKSNKDPLVLNADVLSDVKTEVSNILKNQITHFNNSEKFFTNTLEGNIETANLLAENINSLLENSLVNNELKKEIQKELFKYLDNVSINVHSSVKSSGLPYKILSDGTIKIKRINENNYSTISNIERLDWSLIKKNKEKQIEELYQEGIISEYDYNKLKNTSKPLIMNGKINNAELYEGVNSFWFTNHEKSTTKYSIPKNISGIEEYSNNIENYNSHILSKYFLNNELLNQIDIKENHIELKGKIPVLDSNQEIINLITFYDFENYVKNNKLSIKFKKFIDNEELKPYLAIDEIGDNIIITGNQDFCNYSYLDYKKEYKLLKSKNSNSDELNICNLKFTLNDSNKLKLIEKIRDNHILELESQPCFVAKNDKKTYELDYEDLYDTNDLLDSIEFDDFPDRI